MHHGWIKHIAATLFLATLLILSGCTASKRSWAPPLPNNPSIPLEHLRAAAQYGNARAQYALGYLYFYGLGPEKNTDVAKQWFEKSAQQGLLQARIALNQISGGKDFNQDVRFGTLIQPKLFQAPQYARYTRLSAGNPIQSKTFHSNNTHVRTSKTQSHTASNNPSTTKPNTSAPWPPGNLSLRLYLGKTLAQAQRFVRQHKLIAQARIEKQTGGYAVLFGHFHSVHQAKIAISQLPESTKVQSTWIQSVAHE